MKSSKQQKELTRWLTLQGILDNRQLNLVILIGTLNTVCLIVQAWLFASILQSVIIEHQTTAVIASYFIGLIITIVIRVLFSYIREQLSFSYGQRIRHRIRQHILDRLALLGPAYIQKKPAGSWATMILEQIEELQDFYARYQPQMRLSGIIPITIIIALLPINWAASLILAITTPLIPLFMILVGLSAAEKNRRNFAALSRISGHFLDRLKGLTTIRLFKHEQQEQEHIASASETFRLRTMEVLRQAFLSSAVLEFFASISIAIVAVYYGFAYLGQFHFGGYGLNISLFSGFMVLILAPEYYQPLRDLGAYYHAKAQAVGAADTLYQFMEETEDKAQQLAPKSTCYSFSEEIIDINVKNLVVLSLDKTPLTPVLNFSIGKNQHVAIIGRSGIGKSSFIQALLGFLPYQGSLEINGVELKNLPISDWLRHIAWIGQNPVLPAKTIKQNLLLANPDATQAVLQQTIKQSFIDEFIEQLPLQLDTEIGEDALRLSVGQAQRIAVGRALLQPCQLLLLDEPLASLDTKSALFVSTTLASFSKKQTTIHVTHNLNNYYAFDQVIDFNLFLEDD